MGAATQGVQMELVLTAAHIKRIDPPLLLQACQAWCEKCSHGPAERHPQLPACAGHAGELPSRATPEPAQPAAQRPKGPAQPLNGLRHAGLLVPSLCVRLTVKDAAGHLDLAAAGQLWGGVSWHICQVAMILGAL